MLSAGGNELFRSPHRRGAGELVENGSRRALPARGRELADDASQLAGSDVVIMEPIVTGCEVAQGRMKGPHRLS